MDSPKKASVKHLEFQLQREKLLTKELEEKCKAFHAQISQLEQDKAELRREKVQLSEEAKKNSRYEDRVHFLQRELETKEAIIAQERSKAADARAETDEVRFNANASINSWKQAEEQWILEQTVLNETITKQRDDLSALHDNLATTQRELEDLKHRHQRECQRATKLDESRSKLEVELRGMHEKVEKCQNTIFDLEQKIYGLDLAGEKQKEALCLKDTEIQTLEARIAKHVATEERMEQTITSLNDRINAAKMVNLEGKGENEKLLCDLVDARKENQRLLLQLDSLKRDQEHAAQTQSTLQKSFDDLREKYRLQQEGLKEKNVDVRKHELTISQLTMELKKLESSTSEGGFHRAALETEIARLKATVKDMELLNEQVTEDRDSSREEIRALKIALEKRDEELVVTKNQLEERETALQEEIQSWEKEVHQRQAIIQELTEQLSNANEKNILHQERFLEESEAATKLRQVVARLQETIFGHEQDGLLLAAVAEKRNIAVELWEEHHSVACTFLGHLDQRQHDMYCVSTQQAETIAVLEKSIQDLEHTFEQQTAALSETRERAVALEDAQRALEEALAEKEARRLSSTEKSDILLQQIQSLTDKMQRVSEAREEERSFFGGQLETMSQHIAHVYSVATDGLAEVAGEWWQQKIELIFSCASAAAKRHETHILMLLTEREKFEKQTRELTVLLQEAKNSSNRKGVALAEKQEALLTKIQSLEGQLLTLGKEKDQVSFQLSTLLSRFEKEQKTAEQFRSEVEERLKDEQMRREAAEKQSAKLRNGIDYEIKRKCEYKNALEEIKRLREETEKCRLKEKELATDAITKANDEARYWVDCFDKLKTMAERARRDGTRLPSIDPDTLSRLEAARDKAPGNGAVPLQQQPLNVVAASGAGEHPKHKRNRVEFC